MRFSIAELPMSCEKLCVLLLALSALPCAAADATVEQSAGTDAPASVVDADALEPVRVTASFAPEPAAAVDVLTEDVLDENRVRSLSQLQALVPTLSISAAGGRATPHYVSLRGYTNPWSAPESAVTVYLDGVPVSDFYALDQRLFDIETIEVRRGPQGTGYGVNSEAGVVNIATRAPAAAFRARAAASYASFNTYAVEAGASGELAPRLRGSFAVSRDGSDGYIDNLVGHQPYNGQWGRDLHGRLLWQAGADTELELMLLDRKVDDLGGELYLPVDRASFNQLPTLMGNRLGEFDQAIDHEGWNKLDSTLTGLTARWAGAGLQWRATGSWRDSDVATSTDYDLSPQTWFVMESHYRIEQAHAELQAESAADAKTDWLLGLSLDQRDLQTLRIFQAGPGNPWLLPPGSYVRTDAALPDRTAALFGESRWQLDAARRWGLTAGLRVEHDERRLDFDATALAPATERERTDTQWLPKLAVDLRYAPTHSAYASLAVGGKSGGFNPGVFDGSRAEFKPERTVATEIGLKGHAGASLDYSLAAFHNRIRNYQDLVISESELTVYVANAPLASTQGLEAKLVWRPAANWETGLMVGNVRAIYEDYTIDPANNVRLDGHRLQQVPRWNACVDAKYERGAWWTQIAVDGAGRYAINAYDGLNGTLREELIDGHVALSLHAGWQRDLWTLQLDGTNLTDRRWFPNASYGFGTIAGYDGAMGAVALRRMLGLSLRRDF